MNTENLSTLKIHKLTQAQYERELAAGRIDANALYLTPDEANDEANYATQQELDNLETLVGTLPEGTSATSVVDYINIKTAGVSTDVALEELQNQLDGKAELSHNHDSAYDAIGSAEMSLATAKEYTDTKTSGLASTTTVETLISTHNTDTSAHNDIRALIADLSKKLNTFLDVDDTTTDQLSEVLALIENNKGTLESITSSKINVSDIVNNLTTNSTSKVLSAAQGVMIKGLIDALDAEIDTKADSGHTHTITASASDDDVVVLTGTNGTNGVTYSASHANSGVTAGIYKSVTVNAKGHVTGGTNPTTLAGYGITDAYTKTDIDGALAGKSNTGHTHSISNVTNLQNTLNSKVDLSSNQTVGGNKVFTGTTSTMVLHTYNPLYINNGSDNSKNTSLYTSDSNTFAITSSANNMTFNGENVAMMSDIENVELITINDIDTICGGSVVAASEVTF